MKKTIFEGSACAIITPFASDGSVDYKALRKQVDFQIENGTDAIVVCGTTGEASTLNTREYRQVIKTVVRQVEGRVPVIAGAGSNCTETAVKRSITAESVGADALLIVTPYYNKCSQDGLVAHYDFISDRVGLPIIAYNVPTRTGVDIKPETYRDLAEIPNIVGVKEANGNIPALLKSMSLCEDKLDFYCGNDAETAIFMSAGAKGTISVLANIEPKAVKSIVSSCEKADSMKLQKRYLDLCNVLFADVNPMPVKYAMKLMNLDSGVCRLPLTQPSEYTQARIFNTLAKYNLIAT